MSQDRSINVVAAIRPLADGTPGCVVRWFLGTEHDLPHTDDRFEVVLSALASDGVTKLHEISRKTVTPLNYFMLDAPREEQSFISPDGTTTWWRPAIVPPGPVNPGDADNADLKGKAFGVWHLLAETETSRIQWRAARLVAQAMTERPPTQALLQVDSHRLHDIARNFARRLWESPVRPRDLPAHFQSTMSALRNNLQQGMTLAGAAPILFASEADPLHLQISNLALVANALGHRPTLEALDKTMTEPRQVREHLRLRALHGGELLNYWYDPDGSGAGVPADRGMCLPAAEVLASGCTIPLTSDLIEDCVNMKLQILVEVTQQEREARARTDEPLTSLEEGGRPGNFLADGARGGFDPGAWKITWFMLRDAQNRGHSIEIPSPKRAFVNFDLASNDAASSKEEIRSNPSSVTFATGDGLLEIVITPPDQAEDSTTVTAYNVYGIWEGAPGATPFFADPSRQPTLAMLRPWLMTRRYSLNRDLLPAFPDVEGHPHPRVPQLLANPPWQPVLRQPDVVQSENSGSAEPLPKAGNKGEARYTVDLRSGMRMNKGDLVGVPKAWDLTLPADTMWTPELDRDGRDIVAEEYRPQRYRFWVTSVDAFEQESAPTPVETNDRQAGENSGYFFEPRRRTPIPGPPPGNSVGIQHDQATGTLTVIFETPPEADIAGKSDPAAPDAKRMDSRKLTATVVVFRRRLLSVPKESEAVIMRMAKEDELPDLPQWQWVAHDLSKKGWRRFGSAITLAAPKNGDIWQCDLPVNENHRGWEYMAGISFSAAPQFEKFWAPNVQTGGRTIRVAERSDTSIQYRDETTSETPRASDVTLTRELALINNAVPRPPILDEQSTKILLAKPIPGPPGVRRDLVLMRLLTQGFRNDQGPVETAEWSGTGIKLTEGQAAMCDAALARTLDGDGKPFDPASDELLGTRQMLARAFQSSGTVAIPLRQHPALGFRGLLDLRWKYIPLEIQAPDFGIAQSEATSFRIFGVRAPEDPDVAAPLATVSATGELIDEATYRLTLVKGADGGFDTLVRHSIPTLAIVRAQDDPTNMHWRGVTAASLDGAATVTLSMPQNGGALPPMARIDLFAAQPLIDVVSDDLDREQSRRLLLPVGGGPAETVAWWIVSVSAKGVQSPARAAPMHILRFPPTIEPSAPRAIAVRNSYATDQDYLAPEDFRDWLPEDIRSLDDAKYFPRLIVGWDPPADSVDTYVVIEREERRVSNPSHRLFSLSDYDAWAAIKAIEGTDEAARIEKRHLEAIRQNWLMGNLVQPGSNNVVPTWHVGPDRRLLVEKGLRDITTDEMKVRPGCIDYFGQNQDSVSVMDSNWEFRYRCASFVDLGAQFPANWRYLFSSSSEWSEWRLPETPPLKPTMGKPTSITVAGQHHPFVKFQLIPKLHTALFRLRFMAAMPEHHWEYRAIVRRKLATPMPSVDGKLDPVWIDVGRPQRFTHQPVKILDDEVDRAWSGDMPKLHYRVFIQQFLVLDDGQERLVRGFSDKPGTGFIELEIDLPLPAFDDGEVEYSQEILIA